MSSGTERPALLRVRVLGAGRAPLAWARVYFVEAPVAVPDIAALTNEAGEVDLAAPAAGKYRVGASADGYRSGTAEVMVGEEDSSGEPVRVEVTLRPE